MPLPKSRNSYFDALYNRLSTDLGTALKSKSRRGALATIDAIPLDKCPGLIFRVVGSDPTPRTRLPTIYELAAVIALKAVNTPEKSGDDQLNDLVDAVERALSWREGEPQSPDHAGTSGPTTLGGVCRRAYVSEGVTFFGQAENSAIAIVPITIEVVSNQ